MNIPIYNQSDLNIDDGVEYNEFSEFISQVIDMELHENETELGICKKIITDGTKGLSDKQLYHVKNIVTRYEKECAACGEQISLNEVLVLEGNLCSYHQYLSEKDD